MPATLAVKLIDNQTAGATVSTQIHSETTFIAGGLAGAETITINVWDGNNWVTYYNMGAAVVLSATNNTIVIVGAADIQFVKGTTGAGVTLSRCP